MDMKRRDFLRTTAATVAGVGAAPAASARPMGEATRRWAMVIDLGRCIGCQGCTVACSMENRVPVGKFRTTVSTYQIDEPQGARSAVLPRLCNHCETPPCIPVCPVGATYQRADGIVVVDNTRCVGCAYCVQACPYDARFINPLTQTADKCTFCLHRLEAGLLPACVETCVGGARVFGDLQDPNSEVSRLVASKATQGLRPEMKTAPQVYYIGLDPRLQGKVEGEPSLWEAPAHRQEVQA